MDCSDDTIRISSYKSILRISTGRIPHELHVASSHFTLVQILNLIPALHNILAHLQIFGRRLCPKFSTVFFKVTNQLCFISKTSRPHIYSRFCTN